MTEVEFKKIIKPGDLLIVKTGFSKEIFRILFIVSMKWDFSNVWFYVLFAPCEIESTEYIGKIHYEPGPIEYSSHFFEKDEKDFDVIKP